MTPPSFLQFLRWATPSRTGTSTQRRLHARTGGGKAEHLLGPSEGSLEQFEHKNQTYIYNMSFDLAQLRYATPSAPFAVNARCDTNEIALQSGRLRSLRRSAVFAAENRDERPVFFRTLPYGSKRVSVQSSLRSNFHQIRKSLSFGCGGIAIPTCNVGPIPQTAATVLCYVSAPDGCPHHVYAEKHSFENGRMFGSPNVASRLR